MTNSKTFTKMELEGMKRGTFPMNKEEGRKACKAFREELKAQGFRTQMEWFAGSLYFVKIVGKY